MNLIRNPDKMKKNLVMMITIWSMVLNNIPSLLMKVELLALWTKIYTMKMTKNLRKYLKHIKSITYARFKTTICFLRTLEERFRLKAKSLLKFIDSSENKAFLKTNMKKEKMYPTAKTEKRRNTKHITRPGDKLKKESKLHWTLKPPLPTNAKAQTKATKNRKRQVTKRVTLGRKRSWPQWEC